MHMQHQTQATTILDFIDQKGLMHVNLTRETGPYLSYSDRARSVCTADKTAQTDKPAK